MSPRRRSQLGRRLRSGALLGGQEEEWSSAATFDFAVSPSAKRLDKLDKMNNNSKKLRRQTMMPRKTAAAPVTSMAFASPPLSQRRTRRQSMMPVKLLSPKVTTKGKTAKTQPPSPDPANTTTNAKTKRKLDPVEASPKNKKLRLIPLSKSSSQVRTAPSPTSSRKHKSLSSLPISRSSRKSASDKSGKTQQNDKVASPAKKRALSPSHPKASSPTRKKASQPSPVKESPPPKRRAASRSRSESNFVRRKSLPRGQKKATKVPDKPATPSPKKAVTPQKKASSSVRLPPSSPPAKSPAGRLRGKTPTTRKTSSTALKTPPKRTPKSKSTVSLRSAASPASKTLKTPKADTKKKATSPIKTPPSSNKSTSKKTPTVLSVKKGLAPSKTPPPSQKKTPKKTTRADSMKTPAKTPPSALKKIANKTPMVVLKKVKSPAVKTPSSLKKSTLKITTPSTPSPRRHRLTRSAAKSRMLSTSKSVKHVSLKMDGRSPPSSIASFRKTPSSKKIVAALAPEDLGASPDLPSARTQLQRIRVSIASAQKNRSTQPTPRKALAHTPAVTATPRLDKVITKADIHASGNGKCGSEAVLDNHCDPWQGSTPTARAPLPVTPKSSRASGGNVSRFRSRNTTSTVETHHVQHHTAAAALPQSSTPIKGSRMLDIPSLRPSIKEDTSSLSESLEGDSVDGERADDSVDESVNVDGGETSVDENEEEEEEEEEETEAESTTQNRKSFCSLM